MRNTIQAFLLFALFLSIVLLGYKIDLRSLWEKISQSRDNYHQLENTVKDMQQKILHTADYQTLFSKTHRELNQLQTTLPRVNMLQFFLNNTRQLGEKQGLQFLSIHSNPSIKKDFYQSVSIALTIKGTYQQFLEFFKLLRTTPQCINITHFTLSRESPANIAVLKTENTPDMLVMHAQAVFYYFSEKSKFKI